MGADAPPSANALPPGNVDGVAFRPWHRWGWGWIALVLSLTCLFTMGALWVLVMASWSPPGDGSHGIARIQLWLWLLLAAAAAQALACMVAIVLSWRLRRVRGAAFMAALMLVFDGLVVFAGR